MTRLTEPALSAVDCTGIQLGNEGIDISTWEPSEREFERPTLPGHEHDPDPFLPWLTENRAIAFGLACVPVAAVLRMGVLA